MGALLLAKAVRINWEVLSYYAFLIFFNCKLNRLRCSNERWVYTPVVSRFFSVSGESLSRTFEKVHKLSMTKTANLHPILYSLAFMNRKMRRSDSFMEQVPLHIHHRYWHLYRLLHLLYVNSIENPNGSPLSAMLNCTDSIIINYSKRIRIRGSIPRTNGPWFGSCNFRHWCQQKTIFSKLFCLLLFEGTSTSFFKDKKSWRSHKTVGIKSFITIFVWWYGARSVPLTNASGSASRMPKT